MMAELEFKTKPLGHKSYGSIPHLPGSRRGPADKGLTDEQARILTTKVRNRHDRIIVQEKVDGSNVGVLKLDGAIIPIVRAGYVAWNTPYEQHKMFASWVGTQWDRFDDLLNEGERVCGEWLAQAHSTRYANLIEPFVPFDIMVGHTRARFDAVRERCQDAGLRVPFVISDGPPFSIESALEAISVSHHGSIDPVEGAVWRLEDRNGVNFLGKYVRPEKLDGTYLPEISGKPAVWNWTAYGKAGGEIE